ncbi:CBS domain-containing protein [Nocardioides alkalitolerans]|uniref:CBS domain-containing protein n=1 Tax=Nocardioides alkalitolerans TaxID=281714 RepID=UPI00040DB33D|nr:CBS domain-containing protein [Nocardioides alkalitolerans]
MNIRDALAQKAPGTHTVTPDATVRSALATLEQHNIGALVVSADGASPDGILSERDLVREMHRRADDLPGFLDAPVSAVMTAVLHTCTGDVSIESVMQQMTEHRVRHLPVLEGGGTLVGVVSIGDVVKQRINELEFERDQLDTYVHQG